MIRHKPIFMLTVTCAFVHGMAIADADGPDFFRVTGVAANDVLNIRDRPSPRGIKLGAIPHNGRAVQNLGCQGLPSFADWQRMTETQRQQSRRNYWCRIRYQGVEGWAAGRYLREDGAD